PYAIGSAAGGHEAIHPDLGTLEDFDAFVARAEELGLEVAMDIALQCSPDHPWVTEHPEWFTVRADGTIAYAENPPKKYQDIYPLSFDTDYEGLYAAIRDMLEHWVAHGVTPFRGDNPHTNAVRYWHGLLRGRRARHRGRGRLGAARGARGGVGARAVQAPGLLARHPRHPPPVHALGGPAGLRAAGDPRRHAGAHLGHLQRLRAGRGRA